MIKSNRVQLTLFILLFASSLYAQRFQASLSSVDTSGFYKLEIPLEIMKEAENGDDFLLTNEKGDGVAYVLRNLSALTFNRSYQRYKSTISQTEKSTQIVVETNKRPIDHFYIETKNSDVVKNGFILGSDDSKKWFNVRDEILFNPASKTDTRVFLKIDFPKSNYRFYKVIINDSVSAALNIISANYILIDTVEICNTIEARIEDFKYDKSSRDTTRLSMLLSENVFINDINIYVSAPRFFNREVQMYRSKQPIEALQGVRRKKKGRLARKPSYVSYHLKSTDNQQSTLQLDGRYDSVYMDIINGNNLPLSIDSLTFTASRCELVAYLEGKSTYTLSYGGIPDGQGVYDLSFAAHLPQTIQGLGISSISVLNQIEQLQEKEKSAFKIFIEEYGILIIIFVAILVILSISYRLVKDKKEE